MKDKNKMMPLDLQLFAEDPGNEANTNDSGQENQNTQDNNGSTQEPKTFTQKDVDKIVQGRIAKERKSWEKHLEDQRTEAQKLENMSEKEKKEYQERKRAKELDDREAAITRRELTAQAKVQLADKGIPTELAEILNLTDADACKQSIDTVEKAFQFAVEKAVEERIKGKEPPKKAPENSAITMDSLKNMSTQEINKNWDEIQKLMKQ